MAIPAPESHDLMLSIRRQRNVGRLLCRQHAGPLLAMAALILDDIDVAGEVVSDTIVAACRSGELPDPLGDSTRAQLATSVYRRCLGRLATAERFAPTRADESARLGSAEGALVALAVFSGQDLPQAAAALHLPSKALMDHLAVVLAAVTEAVSSGSWSVGVVPGNA